MKKERFTLFSAVYLIIQKENNVLLLRRFQTGWQDGNYSLIAGHMDGDESVAEAMAREAYEEVGIVIRPEDLRVVHVMHRRSDREYVDFFLTVHRWEGEITNSEPEKCDDLSWFPLTALPKNMVPNVQAALEACSRGVFFSEFG